MKPHRCYLLLTSAVAALLALPAVTRGQAAAPAPSSAADENDSTKDSDVLRLSPFQVDASQDNGYYAQNTLAGSRMKTKLADLGASISVVTKQEIVDTGSVDLNDVFRYEINTEGSSTYTPQQAAFRNDGLVDVNAGGSVGNAVGAFTNANANRIRGLGVPSSAINYFPSISAVPPDAYNIDSIEISRGPNSMLFGLGSPAGIVNTSTAQAVLNRKTAHVEVRTDNWGSLRASVNFNQPLIKDKVAIYGAALYDDREFSRKPSYDISKRAYGAITIKPFPKTVIRAMVEGYDNRNHRPNTLTPIDGVTQWNLAGRPVYDALSKNVTFLSDMATGIPGITITHKAGDVVGPFIGSANSPSAQAMRDYLVGTADFDPALRGGAPSGQALSNSNFTTYGGVRLFTQAAINTINFPMYIPGFGEATQSRSLMQIQGGQLANWFQPLYATQYVPSWGTATNPAANPAVYPPTTGANSVWNNATTAEIFNRDYYNANGWTNVPATTLLGNYRYPGVTDRAIYDWKKINILQADYGTQKNATYEAHLDQEITSNLFFNAGWMRQDFDQSSNYTVGQLNATILRVDPNKYLPDGTPNPYVGKPFVYDFDPDRYRVSEQDDHFRAMLAYTPDFTQHHNWLHWLGHHQLLGLWSRDEYMAATYRDRLNYIAAGNADAGFRYLPNPNPNANGTATGWNFQGKGSLQRNYYLARPGDPMGVVTTAPGEWNANQYSGSIRTYDYANQAFQDSPVTTAYNTFDASTGRAQKMLQSYSAGFTSYLWDDRLVLTMGARVDKFKARVTSTGAITLPDGTVIPALTSAQKWTNGYLNTDTFFNRFMPAQYITGRTKTGGGVLRPFRNWRAIESRANGGNPFWEFVNDFGVSYNWSNNFDAPPSAQVDPLGHELPKPQGVGRDYGFQFELFKHRLFARITWFQATNENQRISAGGTTIGRLRDNMDTTIFRKWARTIALINMGFDPTAPSFDDAAKGLNGVLTQTQEDQVQADTAKIWGQDYNHYTDIGDIGATQDTKAKGVEAEINYNLGGWRNKFTYGKQVTFVSNVLKQYDQLYALRSPTWMSAKAKDFLLPQYQKFVTYNTSSGTAVNLTDFWTNSYGYDTTVRITDPNGNTTPENYFNNIIAPQVSLAKDLDGQEAPNQRTHRWSYVTGYDFTTGRLKGFSIGGAVRWESKMVIGYKGIASGANTVNPAIMDKSDVTKPVYASPNTYYDAYIRYRRKIWHDRTTMTLQVNGVNITESGHLEPVAVNYDGSPWAYRIVDPRQIIFTAGFDF